MSICQFGSHFTIELDFHLKFSEPSIIVSHVGGLVGGVRICA